MANAGFSATIDYFSMAGQNMSITGSADGRSNQVAEANDAIGDVCARDIWGEKIAPSAEYVIKKALTALTALGTVSTVTVGGASKKVMLTQLVVTTGTGTIPTISASGVEVESAAATLRTYALGALDIKKRSWAQDILKILTTANCDLNSATFTFSVNPVTAETAADGIVASDCNGGKVEASYTFVQTGSTAPTFTAKTGYTITAVPTATRNDGAYVEWTVTATGDLTGSDKASA